ncbi:hypothetical protein HDU96_002563 [Phlyctochytrium bullatum]|nr:hypothetical protein HDU96_002563 [Phlyctochytrium bullatum]
MLFATASVLLAVVSAASANVVVVSGAANSFEDCAKFRADGLQKCGASFPPYNANGGPVSGDCITKSSSTADVCVNAMNENKKPYTYYFKYPADSTPVPPPPAPPAPGKDVKWNEKAFSYEDCARFRATINEMCGKTYPQYLPDGGKTSGACITASSTYADKCVQAMDKGAKPFDYSFSYRWKDEENGDDWEEEEEEKHYDLYRHWQPSTIPECNAQLTKAQTACKYGDVNCYNWAQKQVTACYARVNGGGWKPSTPPTPAPPAPPAPVKHVKWNEKAFSYADCARFRATINDMCGKTFPQYAPGGKTSGACITASSIYADKCVEAMNKGANLAKPFDYNFSYRWKDEEEHSENWEEEEEEEKHHDDHYRHWQPSTIPECQAQLTKAQAACKYGDVNCYNKAQMEVTACYARVNGGWKPSTPPTAPPSTPPSKGHVNVYGKAHSYEDCGRLRTQGNELCGKTYPQYLPGGKTSGACITASATYADMCVRAIDTGAKPFDYSFSYRWKDEEENGEDWEEEEEEHHDDLYRHWQPSTIPECNAQLTKAQAACKYGDVNCYNWAQKQVTACYARVNAGY